MTRCSVPLLNALKGGIRPLLVLCFLSTMISFAGAQRFADTLGLPGGSDQGPDPDELVKTRMIADHGSIQPGGVFRLGVLFTLAPKWHIYYKDPGGEIGLPTEIKWTLPEGFTASELRWPVPRKMENDGMTSLGYDGEVLIHAEVTAPAALRSGEAVKFAAVLSWLVCKDDGQCIPGGREISLEIQSGDSITDSANEAIFAKYPAQSGTASGSGSVDRALPDPEAAPVPLSGPIDPKAPPFSFLGAAPARSRSILFFLLLAFGGGLLLNVMPCVLPVLSIKVLSFVRQSGEDRRSVLRLGLFFTLGVMASFALLALLVAALQGAGRQLGWGFQFQEPRFVIIMCAVVFIFGLSLFGVFEIELPGAAMQGASGLQKREGPAGAFFNGVLATALATPCTAPLLGPALGVAFAQPPAVVFLFFMVIGAGMSAPYLLLAAFPGWLRFLPRPGDWMIRFKQLMGFLLMATVVWLVWVLGRQAGGDVVASTLAFLTACGLACWLIGIGFDIMTATPRSRMLTGTSALLIVVMAYGWFPERQLRRFRPADPGDGAGAASSLKGGGLDWEPFSTARVEQLAAEGRAVFLDFTADWCLTCKVNERTVLSRADVQEAFKRTGTAAVQGDYTRQPPEITRVLRYFGRSGVPMYVIFPKGRPAEAVVLPEVLTPSMVIEAVEAASK